MHRPKINMVTLAIATTLFISFIPGQSPAQQAEMVALDSKMPVDTAIAVGKLDNGLKFYVRENRKPENRAALRLVVNAGSVLEDEDQQGLAHFVEHMAFNGTEKFHKQQLVDYLESIGMRFGPDLNAYTSFDETVYMLQIPMDDDSVVNQAFEILREWAGHVAFEGEEIDKERGVVGEEWRLGRGAESRILDRQLPVLFKDSRYAVRLPIGQKAIIDTAHYETLRRFYREWYRPDLMAVVAVGDFKRATVVALIKKHFGDLAPSANPRGRLAYEVPDHAKPLTTIVTDPEATQSRLSIYFKRPVAPEGTHRDYRRSIVENLYNAMLNDRLRELSRQADPPFLFGFSAEGSFVRTKGTYFLGAVVKPGSIPRGIEALLTEAERVQRHGFTASELERQKKELLRGMEQSYNERDKTPSQAYAAEFIRNFLTEEPIPGIAYEFELYQHFLPTITLAEVNQLAEQWITESNRVVAVSAPEQADQPIPSEKDILAIFAGVKAQALEPYVDKVTEASLLEAEPVAAAVTVERMIEKLQLTEWQLANGVRVFVKPTDFKNDEIRFTAFSPGGHSLVKDADYFAAATAASVIEQGGVGRFDLIALGKMLAGKVVDVSPWIDELDEGVSGSSSPADVETMLQLIYLYFTDPRADSTAFMSYQTRLRGLLANRNARPETAFSDTLQVLLSQHHFRSRPWSEALLDEMSLTTSVNVYRERFADASDFTFIFVGNIDLATFKPLVQKYLGSLPALHRNETWRDVGRRYPPGIIERSVRKGVEPKSRVQVVVTGDFEWTRKNRYALSSMAEVLEIKLREVLREDLGGTYGVDVSASTSRFPVENYSIRIGFGCAPGRVEELVATVWNQIDSLRTYGPDGLTVDKVREMQKRERETDLKENGFWLAALQFNLSNELDPMDILNADKLIESLDAAKVQQTAQQYLRKENYVKVVLLPEG